MSKQKSKLQIFKKIAVRYPTPKAVQGFLHGFPYNRETKGETLRSARSALLAKKAHCFEAAFLAAAILEQCGYPPQVLSFESQDGLDHVICVFQERGRWGAVARSRDEGLHGRPPIFKNLKALAESYFDPYVDLHGRITGYQLASLDDSGADWRTSSRNVWKAERYLLELPHLKFRSSQSRYDKLLASYKKNGPMKRKSFWW
jgi:hypothetical protein